MLAALGCVVALSTGAAAFVVGQDGPSTGLRAEQAPIANGEQMLAASQAAQRFIGGMATGDEQAVWMFASEEDQAAFATEKAVFDAFAELYPALTSAEQVVVQDVRQEGDTPFVDALLRADDGSRHVAEIGLWLDDAGDWKVVSLDVEAARDLVASR
jgi:hypothetical protein